MAKPIRPQHCLNEEDAKKLIAMLDQDKGKPIHPSKKNINIEKIRKIVFEKENAAPYAR